MLTEKRQQMNLATAYLDGSDLYGTEERDLMSFRTFQSGQVQLEGCPR